MQFRIATMQEVPAIMQIITDAKTHLKTAGIDQWQDGYPDESDILADINAGSGYVFTDGEDIAAYACINFDGEPSYDDITGTWLSNGPYAVVHRMAASSIYRGQGFADALLIFAQTLCEQKGVHSIKIDTDEANKAMQHILQKNGFSYCGGIRYVGTDKIAFEKLF